MRKLMNVVVALGLMAGVVTGVTGCSFVGAGMGTNNQETGEAWWVKNTGLNPYLLWSSKVFFCPAPVNGPAQCKEAKMVEPTAK